MRLAIATLVLFALATGSAAQAGPLGWLINDMKVTFHRNNCWPEPFVYPDKMAVVAPFEAMTHRGWQEQNLLGPHHFDPETNQLTEAGAIKLRWIITQAPPEFRAAYIEQDGNPQVSAARMKSARQTADQIVQGGAAAVHETELVSHSASGAYFDSIYQKFESSTPEPRLPASSGDADTGGY